MARDLPKWACRRQIYRPASTFRTRHWNGPASRKWKARSKFWSNSRKSGLANMLRKPVVLITGASGEIGHGLIERLAAIGDRAIITLDLNPLETALSTLVQRQIIGSIL